MSFLKGVSQGLKTAFWVALYGIVLVGLGRAVHVLFGG